VEGKLVPRFTEVRTTYSFDSTYASVPCSIVG